MNRASVFEWHKRFKEGTESMRDDERCGRSKQVNTPELIGQRFRVRIRVRIRVKVLREFRKRFCRKRPALFKSGQWHFHQDNAPVHNSIMVMDYLSKWASRQFLTIPIVKTLVPVTFAYSLSFRGCCYETIEEMKEVVTKVIDMLTPEDFDGAFQKLLEQYKKCIAAGGDYFKGD